ncbi:MAG: protein translocase subunit SecD [bacterium]|nr:protein translocase subunit SecD [Patescibacteria group bacterium]MDW8279811.1 protein translocase subunit SecD [bacterium]
MKKDRLYLAIIILVTVISGIFIYPNSFLDKYLPWKLGLDLVGGSHLVYNIDLSQINENDRSSVLDGLRDVIEKRVNLFGVSEPQVFIAQSGGNYQLVVELAGVHNISDAIKTIGSTPFLEFREVELIKDKDGNDKTNYIPTNLNGRYITGAKIEFNQTTGRPQVAISFNDEGSKIFEELTAKNIGKPLAIFLDGNLIEQPVVQEKITGGNAVITGKFNINDAKLLVSRFNAGALPAPINLVDQFVVSPFLGIDSLRKSIFAGIIGALLVVLFMIIYYKKYGFFAALALLIYIVLTLGIFKIFGTTMTLAGIAGFIITIGMAVDANILIFERVKEEFKKGISEIAAINEGFHRAWPSIRDSNMASIITALILYFFTSSFVRGFALTLGIGVLVSMFSAITTTRLFLKSFSKIQKND